MLPEINANLVGLRDGVYILAEVVMTSMIGTTVAGGDDRIRRKKIYDFFDGSSSGLSNFLADFHCTMKLLLHYHALPFSKNFIFMINLDGDKIFFGNY